MQQDHQLIQLNTCFFVSIVVVVLAPRRHDVRTGEAELEREKWQEYKR